MRRLGTHGVVVFPLVGGHLCARQEICNPVMPFKGVRISSLILARNWLLARLAFSASSLRRAISAVRTFMSDSDFLRSLMSLATPSRAGVCL
jgi:hypothetical protein